MSKSKASAMNELPAPKSAAAKEGAAVVEIKKKTSSQASIASHMREVIRMLGEDTEREGLANTPERMEKALQYLTSGYAAKPEDIVNGALFGVNYDEVVIVRDIEFFSMCEHHMLPFFGKMHVAYLPDKKVIGLSKIPRLVDAFARRLQIQERLTQQVAEVIQKLIEPKGVAVICEARHFCMMMRGVEKQHSGAVTSAMLGAFRNNKETRNELLSLLGRSLSGI
ncbi:MAG TPA: GTP cyclohydrolase I FolE [Bryobacteraceae bacterium]|nr:GTP cyclohydrolase I FolE [Bryobacteraceae bacterium]